MLRNLLTFYRITALSRESVAKFTTNTTIIDEFCYQGKLSCYLNMREKQKRHELIKIKFVYAKLIN